MYGTDLSIKTTIILVQKFLIGCGLNSMHHPNELPLACSNRRNQILGIRRSMINPCIYTVNKMASATVGDLHCKELLSTFSCIMRGALSILFKL